MELSEDLNFTLQERKHGLCGALHSRSTGTSLTSDKIQANPEHEHADDVLIKRYRLWAGPVKTRVLPWSDFAGISGAFGTVFDRTGHVLISANGSCR